MVVERLIAFVAGVLTIAGAIVGAVGWTISKRRDASAVAIEEPISALTSNRREVLVYNSSNEQIPGTFEHVVSRYSQMAPTWYRQTFLTNPRGVRRAAGMYYPASYFSALMMLSVFLGSLILPTFLSAQSSWISLWRNITSDLGHIFGTIAFVAFVFGFIVYQYKLARDAKRAIDAASAYEEFLSQKGISVGVEFTRAIKDAPEVSEQFVA